MISIPKHLSHIIQRSALKAMPTLTDPVSVTPETKGDWDYTCPSAMKIFNKSKKDGAFGFASCQAMATAIAEQLQ